MCFLLFKLELQYNDIPLFQVNYFVCIVEIHLTVKLGVLIDMFSLIIAIFILYSLYTVLLFIDIRCVTFIQKGNTLIIIF